MAPEIDGTFDVVGARRALRYFGALDPSRLAHAYLFSGPAGVGKKTFARRLAQSLLCEKPKATLLGYDDTCRACVMFRAGTHPDYHETLGLIKIGSSVADDEEETTARGLIRELSLRPYVGRYRVAMLGDVEFSVFSEDAAHTLLKLLEDPQPAIAFLLTSNAPRNLLPTIRSRLIEIPFEPLTNPELATLLERDGAPPDRAQAAVAGALGSVTRARALLEGDESGLRDGAIAWFVDAVRGDVPDVSFLRQDDKTLSSRERTELLREMLDVVRTLARDWTALATAGPTAPLLAPDARDRIAALPKRSAAEAVRALAAVGRALELADTAVVNFPPRDLVLNGLRMDLAP